MRIWNPAGEEFAGVGLAIFDPEDSSGLQIGANASAAFIQSSDKPLALNQSGHDVIIDFANLRLRRYDSGKYSLWKLILGQWNIVQLVQA